MTYVPLVTVDVGNTRVKVGVFDRAASRDELVEPIACHRWLHTETPDWPDVTPDRYLVGSVAPSVSAKLLESTPTSWPTAEHVASVDLGLRLDVDEPTRLGVDRVANAAAASVLCPEDNVAIVDAGTAIKVDLVTRATRDEPATFRGGAIFPGLQMSADALTGRTELLPRLDMAAAANVLWPGKNTLAAMQVGVRDAARGGVFHFISRFRAKYTPHCRQLLCGGDAEHFAMGLEEREIFDTLTLSGLALASLHS